MWGYILWGYIFLLFSVKHFFSDTSITVNPETVLPTKISLSINITTAGNGTFCPFTLLVNCTTIDAWSWIVTKSANFEFPLEKPISTVTLDDLAEFTNYKCELQQAGQFILYTNFRTSEDGKLITIPNYKTAVNQVFNICYLMFLSYCWSQYIVRFICII